MGGALRRARILGVDRRLASLTLFVLLVGSAGVAPGRAQTGERRFAVGIRVLRLVDTSREIRFADGKTEPRTLVTYVRYPAEGSASSVDAWGAPAARGAGPFPLVVFGHGFAVTPAPYAPLLRAWAAAGYVVAAPVFPLENANAPGGPDESDLVNQPDDMRFVISRLLAASARHSGPLAGLIDRREVAVAGHSDGGETAVMAAFVPVPHGPSIKAAVILSGAQTPSGFTTFSPGAPPLLATQGTADTINPPSITNAFFGIAPRPKFLLYLDGATHLQPYVEQPWLPVVERVTIAFLNRYLRHGSTAAVVAAARDPGVARLVADP